MTSTQLARVQRANLVEEARFITRKLGKIGHLAGAVAVLTHSVIEWSVARGGLKREGLYAENN